MATFAQIADAEKLISHFPGWSAPEPETGYVWFDAPLEIGGVVERALVIHGGCYYNRPDCHVTFELRIGKTPGRRCVPLMRIEWRSLNDGHTNPRRRGNALSGLEVPSTHIHPFEPNWSEAEGRMRMGNLRMADVINEDIQTFEELRSIVGNLFRISNIDVVQAPPWEYSLFSEN